MQPMHSKQSTIGFQATACLCKCVCFFGFFSACKAIREDKRKECLLFRSTDSMNRDSSRDFAAKSNINSMKWNQNVNSP